MTDGLCSGHIGDPPNLPYLQNIKEKIRAHYYDLFIWHLGIMHYLMAKPNFDGLLYTKLWFGGGGGHVKPLFNSPLDDDQGFFFLMVFFL